MSFPTQILSVPALLDPVLVYPHVYFDINYSLCSPLGGNRGGRNTKYSSGFKGARGWVRIKRKKEKGKRKKNGRGKGRASKSSFLVLPSFTNTNIPDQSVLARFFFYISFSYLVFLMRRDGGTGFQLDQCFSQQWAGAPYFIYTDFRPGLPWLAGEVAMRGELSWAVRKPCGKKVKYLHNFNAYILSDTF